MAKRKKNNYSTFTICINYPLSDIKAAYKKHFGTENGEKITKADCASWLESLAQADIESDMPGAIDTDTEEEKEESDDEQ